MNNYTIQKINSNNCIKSYLKLLKQDFTIDIDMDNLNINDFNYFINNLNDDHQIFIVMDNINNNNNSNSNTNINITNNESNNNVSNNDENIIGSATILIETKIIHNFGKVAHIEDVIVDNNYRGKGLGKMLINTCINYAKDHNCYKIILNCNDKNIPFYEKCGFSKKENEMALYF